MSNQDHRAYDIRLWAQRPPTRPHTKASSKDQCTTTNQASASSTHRAKQKVARKKQFENAKRQIEVRASQSRLASQNEFEWLRFVDDGGRLRTSRAEAGKNEVKGDMVMVTVEKDKKEKEKEETVEDKRGAENAAVRENTKEIGMSIVSGDGEEAVLQLSEPERPSIEGQGEDTVQHNTPVADTANPVMRELRKPRGHERDGPEKQHPNTGQPVRRERDFDALKDRKNVYAERNANKQKQQRPEGTQQESSRRVDGGQDIVRPEAKSHKTDFDVTAEEWPDLGPGVVQRQSTSKRGTAGSLDRAASIRAKDEPRAQSKVEVSDEPGTMTSDTASKPETESVRAYATVSTPVAFQKTASPKTESSGKLLFKKGVPTNVQPAPATEGGAGTASGGPTADDGGPAADGGRAVAASEEDAVVQGAPQGEGRRARCSFLRDTFPVFF